MSAPRTNIEEQERRHIWPLVGIAAVCLFALVLFIGWSFMVAERGNTPRTPQQMMDDRTGQVEQTQPSIAPPDAGAQAPVPQTDNAQPAAPGAPAPTVTPPPPQPATPAPVK